MGLFDIFKKKEKEYFYKIPSTGETVKVTKEEYESINKPAPKISKEKPKISEKKSENNKLWMECSKRQHEALQEGKLGLARNEMFTMAQIREKEGAFNDALKLYMLVFAYDCSGVNDINGYKYGAMPSAYIAPGVVNRIRITTNKGKISDTQFRKIYYDSLDKDGSLPPLSVVTVDEAYRLLRKALKDGVDPANESLARKEKAFIRAIKNGEKK